MNTIKCINFSAIADTVHFKMEHTLNKNIKNKPSEMFYRVQFIVYLENSKYKPSFVHEPHFLSRMFKLIREGVQI